MPEDLSRVDASSKSTRAITWRSVTIGLLGSLLICTLTPYNDFVLNNTYLIGNSLPVVVVMAGFVLAVLVNAPLHRLAPRFALSSGELACAMIMMLIACAVPGSGLLRYLPPALVNPFFRAQSNPEYLQVLETANLPAWMFPAFAGDSPAEWGGDPIVTGFRTRWTGPGDAPYLAWLRPMLTWGLFVAALWGAVLSLMGILRRQWIENERIAFPLAQVHLALIDQPADGRALNAILRRRSFWIAFALVFGVHIWNGCGVYWPTHFTAIPLAYDLRSTFSDPPFQHIEDFAKQGSVFFIVVSLTFFINTSLAFTLWSMYVLLQVVRIALGVTRGDATVPGALYQHWGAAVGYALGILWIARHHWAMVLRQTFRGEAPQEPGESGFSYPLLFWLMIASILVMVGWLLAAGMTLAGAVVIVLMLLTAYLVVARIVAETGLVFVGVQVPPFVPMLASAYGGKWLFPLRDFVVATFMNSLNDLRENIAVYSTHGMVVAKPGMGRRFVGIVLVMLVLAYPIGYFAHLWTEYHYAATIDVQQTAPINEWAADKVIESYMERPAVTYSHPPQPAPHSRRGHAVGGLVATLAVTFLRLRFSFWPIHPVGVVLVYTWPISQLWLSILIGWLAKVIVLRFGGSKLYSDAKPLMLGLIVGESMAIGVWLLVAAVLGAMGVPYQTIRVLPI